MYTIVFLKKQAFQLFKRHISTCKITRMVALTLFCYSFHMVNKGKYLSRVKNEDLLSHDVIGIIEQYTMLSHKYVTINSNIILFEAHWLLGHICSTKQ